MRMPCCMDAGQRTTFPPCTLSKRATKFIKSAVPACRHKPAGEGTRRPIVCNSALTVQGPSRVGWGVSWEVLECVTGEG